MSDDNIINKIESRICKIEERTEDIKTSMHVFILEMKEWKAKQNQMCENHHDSLTKIDHSINGNGKPGMIDKLSKFEEQVYDKFNEIEKKQVLYDNALKINKYIIYSIISVIPMLLCYGIYFIIKNPEVLLK